MRGRDFSRSAGVEGSGERSERPSRHPKPKGAAAAGAVYLDSHACARRLRVAGQFITEERNGIRRHLRPFYTGGDVYGTYGTR